MPLWQLFVPEGAYTPDDKVEFSEDISKLYTDIGLPKFYVSVIFHEIPKASFLIGAEPRDDFVRITVDHIARRMAQTREHLKLPEDFDLGAAWLQLLLPTLNPYVADRGFNWELHMDETPKEYWYIDGLVPPPGWSEEEKRWALENKATAPPPTGPATDTLVASGAPAERGQA